MASDNIPGTVLNLIDTASATYINDTFVSLWAAISVSFRSLLILFLILYGLALWRGLIKAPMEEIFYASLKVIVIYALVSTWGLYSGFVVAFITNTPDALAGVISGGAHSGSSASEAIGDVYIAAIGAADNAFSADGWFLPYILGGMILLSSTIMVIFALFLIALSKIALAVLVGLGPLFIVLLMFKPTQKVFQAWMQQVINYILIVVLTVAVLGLVSAIAGSAVSLIPESGITLGDVMPASVVFLIVFLLLTQVMSIASGLAGGMALTTQHVGALVGYKGSQALSSGYRSVSRRARKVGGAVSDKGWSAVKDRFRRNTVKKA